MSPDNKPEAPRPGEQPVPLQARIDNETAEGIYSNIASIMFNRSEFYLDFGRLVPGKKEVKVHARIICPAAHARDLARALSQNIQQYEERFGPIPGDAPGAGPHAGPHAASGPGPDAGDGRKVGF